MFVEALKDFKPVKGRIIGGNIASNREFPYQGFLIIRTSETTATLCGCVLIHPRWALSSAKCTYGYVR